MSGTLYEAHDARRIARSAFTKARFAACDTIADRLAAFLTRHPAADPIYGRVLMAVADTGIAVCTWTHNRWGRAA